MIIKKLLWDFLIKWLLWDKTGLRYIWSKFIPPDPANQQRPPSTLLLWLIGMYVVCFGVASIRYENRINIIENRANTIFTQLATNIYKEALKRVPIVQNMTMSSETRY